MILMMTSKTFTESFVINEPEDTVLEAIYLIASDRIRFSKKYDEQCMKAPFKPGTSSLMELTKDGLDSKKMNPEFVDAYRKQLSSECDGFIAAMLMSAQTNKDKNIIILTTHIEEKSLMFLEILQRWIFEKFEVAIPIYKKSDRLSDFVDFKIKHSSMNIIRKTIKRDKKVQSDKLKNGTDSDRIKYYSDLSKKELKKKLKKAGIYEPGSKVDMVKDAVQYL